jgi:hypothetical protein
VQDDDIHQQTQVGDAKRCQHNSGGEYLADGVLEAAPVLDDLEAVGQPVDQPSDSSSDRGDGQQEGSCTRYRQDDQGEAAHFRVEQPGRDRAGDQDELVKQAGEQDRDAAAGDRYSGLLHQRCSHCDPARKQGRSGAGDIPIQDNPGRQLADRLHHERKAECFQVDVQG